MTATELLAKLCAKHDIVIIGGGPNTGKTWLADHCASNHHVLHTDHWHDGTIARLEWDDVPAAVADYPKPSRCIIEGVRAPAVLRHGVKAGGLLWMSTPMEHGPPSDKQMRAARLKALLKMQREGWLDGVEVEFAP